VIVSGIVVAFGFRIGDPVVRFAITLVIPPDHLAVLAEHTR
jgi:hypothetical protein